MNKREKIYSIGIAVLLVVLVVKSFVLDPYTPQGASEESFYQWTTNQMATEYDSVLFTSNVLVNRIVDIGEKEEEGVTLYVAKIRRYVAGVLPYKEVYIKEDKDKFQ